MLLLLPLLLLGFFAWRGGHTLGIAMICAGLLIEVLLALRLLRASVGGVGGHAEWVREVARRPGIDRDPAWLGATLLVVAGAVVAFVG